MSQQLYVGNLDYRIDDLDLKDIFSAYGAVRRVGRLKGGFAFVTMETEEQAQAAIAHLQGKEVAGRAMNLAILIGTIVAKAFYDIWNNP